MNHSTPHAEGHTLKFSLRKRLPWRLPSRLDVFLITVLLLASLPSTLVILDRWLEWDPVNTPLHEWWYNLPQPLRMNLPSYFPIILLASVSLWALFIVTRKAHPTIPCVVIKLDRGHRTLTNPVQGIGVLLIILGGLGSLGSVLLSLRAGRLPGWDFAAFFGLHLGGWVSVGVVPAHLQTLWRTDAVRWLLLAYTHLAIAGMLASLFGHSDLWVLALPTGLVSAYALIRTRTKIPPVFWISSLALLLFTAHINAWWFSIVGDEHAFHSTARWLLETKPLSSIGTYLFDANGVYGSHPFFSTVLQAFFMKVFGTDNFGWRFSNIYLSALAVGMFYLFFRAFMDERIACWAGFSLAISHYLMSFSKIGYNNLQALFAMALVLLTASWAIRATSVSSFAMLGATLGFCFYIYPAALFVPPLAFFLLLLYRPPTTRGILQLWGVTLAVALLLVSPLLLQSQYWESKIPGTFLNRPELTLSFSSFGLHLGKNTLYAVYSFLLAPEETHFVAASYVDPLTGVFVLIGAALLASRAFRSRFTAFVVGSFAYLLLFLGASHDRALPSTTRMFMLLPWFALLAALGATWLLQRATEGPTRVRQARGVVIHLGLILLVSNWIQAYPYSRARMAQRYQSIQVLFLRDARHILDRAGGAPRSVYFLNIPSTFLVPSLYGLLDLYSIPYEQGQIVELDANEQVNTANVDFSLLDPHSVVIIAPWLGSDLLVPLERELRLSGKEPYEVRNTQGKGIFEIWLNNRYETLPYRDARIPNPGTYYRSALREA